MATEIEIFALITNLVLRVEKTRMNGLVCGDTLVPRR